MPTSSAFFLHSCNLPSVVGRDMSRNAGNLLGSAGDGIPEVALPASGDTRPASRTLSFYSAGASFGVAVPPAEPENKVPVGSPSPASVGSPAPSPQEDPSPPSVAGSTGAQPPSPGAVSAHTPTTPQAASRSRNFLSSFPPIGINLPGGPVDAPTIHIQPFDGIHTIFDSYSVRGSHCYLGRGSYGGAPVSTNASGRAASHSAPSLGAAPPASDSAGDEQVVGTQRVRRRRILRDALPGDDTAEDDPSPVVLTPAQISFPVRRAEPLPDDILRLGALPPAHLSAVLQLIVARSMGIDPPPELCRAASELHPPEIQATLESPYHPPIGRSYVGDSPRARLPSSSRASSDPRADLISIGIAPAPRLINVLLPPNPRAVVPPSHFARLTPQATYMLSVHHPDYLSLRIHETTLLAPYACHSSHLQ